MKKTNNKGFSLVELIIVIAIMAILAGAIAPALIRYIDKSRKSNDTSSADTIETAINTAVGNETINEYLTAKGAIIEFKAGEKLTSALLSSASLQAVIKVVPAGALDADWKASNGKTVTEAKDATVTELALTLGEKVPKLKYKKNAKSGSKSSGTPESFYATITPEGAVEVYVAPKDMATEANYVKFTESGKIKDGEDNIFELAPEVCDSYQ